MTTSSPHDPYAPPQTIVQVEQPGPGSFSIDLALKQAFSATKDNFGLCVGVGVVGLLLMLLSAVTVIGYFLVVPVLAWGGARFLLNMIDGDAKFEDLWAGFSSYGSVLGRCLLLGLLTFALALVGNGVQYVGMVSESQVLTSVGSIVSIVFMLAVSIRLYFAFFYLVDTNVGAIDAMVTSWNATRGNVLRLIGLAIVSGVIAVLGILALGVGIFFTAPMAYAMWASAFRQLNPKSPAAIGHA